ncbi:MAG: VanZ family protein [Candidatus Omnitrophota bacterium]
MRLSRLTILIGFFIVISASFMRQLMNVIYSQIGKPGAATALGIFFVLIFLFVALRLARMPLEAWRKVIFFIVCALGLYLSWQLKIVEERIHVLEYGLLGYLVTRDLLKNTFSFKSIAFIILTITIFAFLDEGFQYVLPYRVWELRDAGLNLIGGLWGAALFFIKNQLKR